jgi:hypothetical protein
MPPMGDYYKFKCTHETQIKEWWLNYSPNYVSITKGIMVPSDVMTSNATMTISTKNLVSGNARIGISTNGKNPLLIFNPSVEFFCNCEKTIN